MFFLFAVLAMIGYVTQATLLVHHARKIDGLSLAAYRNISLIIGMLPLLFFVKPAEWTQVPQNWLSITLACITGLTALALGLQASKFLPVGIMNAIKSSFMVLTSILLGVWFFDETLSLVQSLLIAILIVGAGFLSLQKSNHMPHLDTRTYIGIGLCTVSGIVTATSFYYMSQFARDVSPFLSGYLWEVGIGFCALIFLLGRKILFQKGLTPIPLKNWGKIALMSSPTIIGTGCFAYAVTLGPMGIASAIGAGGVAVSMILAYFWYDETLKPIQWGTILGIIGVLVALKMT